MQAMKSEGAEPGYIAQTGEPPDQEQRRQWINDRCREARGKGFTFFRASVDRANGLTLVEGWIDPPNDQGAPRFQYAAGDSHDQ